MSKQQVRMGVGVGLVLALAGGVASATRSPDPGVDPPGADRGRSAGEASGVRVATAPVNLAPGESLRVYGTTRAQSRAVLSFAQAGRLVDRPVHVGDRVERGAVLARLDPQPFSHAVALASAGEREVGLRLEQLARDRARMERLHDQGVVSEADFEATTSAEQALAAQHEQVETQTREARRAQQEAVLRAPYAGVVSAVHLMAKEFAAPGVPVMEISGEDGLEIEVQVSEAARQKLTLETPVSVDFPLINRRGLRGRIRQLGDDGERTGGLFPVVVQVDSPGLSAGLSAEVAFSTGEQPGLSVPLEAVINRSGRVPYVFRVVTDPRGKVAQRVPVTLLALVGARLVVEGRAGLGLQAGDLVITDGHAQVTSSTLLECD